MGIIVSLFVGAAILGTIIALMEEGGFPGWWNMVICVLATSIPAGIVNMLLPPGLFLVGLVVGAICGGIAISATCGMGVKRASIAAGVYLAIQAAISFAFYLAL